MTNSRDGRAESASAGLEVIVVTAAGDRVAGSLHDVSLTGAFVRCPNPLPEGTACRVVLPPAGFKGLPPPAAGRVARREAEGMAVEFLEMIGLDWLHRLQDVLRAAAALPQPQREARLGFRPPGHPSGGRAGPATRTLEFRPELSQLPFSREDFCTIVRGIWGTLLALEVEPLDARAAPPPGEPGLTGRVSLTGAWRAEVCLECSLPLGELAAGRLFATEGRPASAEQIRDTVAELTNITAGNLKRLAPVPCDLGLPEVESAAAPRRPRGRRELEVTFRCARLEFRVAVTQPGAPAGPGPGSGATREMT
jgi:hypothetical protein